MTVEKRKDGDMATKLSNKATIFLVCEETGRRFKLSDLTNEEFEEFRIKKIVDAFEVWYNLCEKQELKLLG